MSEAILLALDGSPDSLQGSRMALALAVQLGCEVVCLHAYDERIHDTRFREMEPGLPAQYQEASYLARLRESHGTLMTEGFAALSRGYLEGFLAEAHQAGVSVQEVVRQGRNYAVVLEQLAEGAFGLAVLGAGGLGAQGDGLLGSTTTRVLRRATCDVLVARHAAPWRGRPLVVGVDGSQGALLGVRKALNWARALGGSIELAAAYDPGLHRTVFATMGRSLSAERQREVGLDRQQELHEDLIDDGLGRLYATFLEQAQTAARQWGARPHAHLLQGKAYRALARLAADQGAGLLVLGRFGHHLEPGTDIGATAEAAARLAPCSVLVAGAEPETAPARDAAHSRQAAAPAGMAWDAEALVRLERVPGFARPMARAAVEQRVRAHGETQVTVADFTAAALAFGMGRPDGES